MRTWPMKRVLKYGVFGGTILGTTISLRANQYNVDAIGVVRLGRAAITVFGIGLKYKIDLYGKNLNTNSQEFLDLKSKVHKESAESLLELCKANKGVFMKVGQHIGALDYLVPKEYVDTMKVLHSHAPCSPIEDIYKVLQEDLKQNPKEIFSEIDPEPLGAASLAQVHKARLIDGSIVAVKVQHPYVKGNSLIDMKTMELLVRIVSKVFPNFKFQWLVEETKRNIPLELDFLEEAKNTEKARQMFKHFPWLKIPKIYSNLSTSRVLTMEFLEGGQVNDLEYIQNNKINPIEVSDKLGQLYSQMIFVQGFVHSDPHPGNILVHKTPSGSTDIILLDHGLYATLSTEIRCEYAKLWLSILNKNKVQMKEHATKLGVGEFYALFSCMISGRTWDSIEAGLETTKYSINEKELFQKEIPGLLHVITDVLTQVNRQMLLILKTNDLLRGLEFTLQTHYRMTSFLVMSRCCVRSIYKEQMKECKTRLQRLSVSLQERWTLFKLSVYYFYLQLYSIVH